MIDEFMLEEIKPKKDSISFRDSEADIMIKLSRTKFLEELEKSGINLENVASGKRIKNEEFYRFNILLDRLNNDENISMIDMVLALEENFFDMKTVVKCLNEENEYCLRDEMIRQYNVKKYRSKLEKIIE